MPYTPAPADRITVRRYTGDRALFTKTGTVLHVYDDGVIHFQDDSGRRVYLATSTQLASLGQSQTITPA
jgi:hypothetical protein